MKDAVAEAAGVGIGSVQSPAAWALKHAKRVMVTVAGLALFGIGIAMIVLPGPALLVIPIGLGILSTEYVWARNLLHWFKERFKVALAASLAATGCGAVSASPRPTEEGHRCWRYR